MVQSGKPWATISDLGLFCALPQMGCWEMPAEFLEVLSCLASILWKPKSLCERGTSWLCRQCKVQHFLTGNGAMGRGRAAEESSWVEGRSKIRSKKGTRYLTPHFSSPQDPGCDEVNSFQEVRLHCDLLDEWIRSPYVCTKPHQDVSGWQQIKSLSSFVLTHPTDYKSCRIL